MPIGASKVGALGGLVPGGSVTFNASGTFSVPPGVKIVSIEGKGAIGNPGNPGNPGNSGTPGLGGGGGGGSPAPSPSCMPGGTQGGGFFTNFPPNPGGFGGLTGQGQAFPGGTVGNPGGTGSSGASGQAGQAGQAGNTGQSSSGLGNNFAGGAGGNAGAAGAAGNGGSGGVGGARGPSCPAGPIPNVPGASGSGGGGPGGASGIGGPGQNRNAGGGGGGGAGVTNDGGAGAAGTTNVTNFNAGKGGTTSGFCVQFASFDPLPAGFSGPTATTGGSTGLRFGQPVWAGNALGLRGNPTNNPRDYRCMNPGANPTTFVINNNPQKCGITRCNPAVRSGAGGGQGSCGTPSLRAANGGAAGGGRGNAGNPGGAGGGGGTGATANPTTFNCVPVTPGCSYPITVASPGGQVIISWNPQ